MQNWGCGNFGGFHELKAVLQLLAASEARRTNLSYHTFNYGTLAVDFKQLHSELCSKEVRVGQVWNSLLLLWQEIIAAPPREQDSFGDSSASDEIQAPDLLAHLRKTLL